MVKCGDQNNWFVDGEWRTLTQSSVANSFQHFPARKAKNFGR